MSALHRLEDSRAGAQASYDGALAATAPRAVVLVVDDHEDTRFMLRAMLESRGLEVVEAADGEEAIGAAERARPGLVLMDGTLPRLDGPEAARRIRESECLRDTPVVMLSARAEPDFRVRALASGCDAFLVKPFSAAQLYAVLERYDLSGRAPRPIPARPE